MQKREIATCVSSVAAALCWVLGANVALAEEPSRAQVLARFSGGEITVGDMEDAIARQAPTARARLVSTEARQRFLESLIRYDLLVLEAQRRGYADSPAVVRRTDEQAVSLLRDRAFDPQAIAKAEVKRVFEQNAARYARPLRRRASHIQVKTEAEARALISELADADAATFARAATLHSTDQRTRIQGGQLGYFDRQGLREHADEKDAVARELVDAVFTQKGVVEVVKQPLAHAGGFSVLMVTGEIPALAARFKQAEEEIRVQLAVEAQARALEALEAQLRSQTPPAVQEELLPLIVLDPIEPPRRLPQGFPAAPRDPRAPMVAVESDGV